MAYSTTIYDPKQGMETILASMEKFDKDRFLYALRYKHYDQNKLELMAEQVADYRKKLEKEHKRLLELACVFNHRFVTDNNKCFQTALMLLNKLRSGISEVKRIYLMFCPRWNRKNFPNPSINNQIRSVFDYSIFSIDSIQYSLFELDEYPPCVQGLYNELSKFFSQLNLSLLLCISVLEDEEKIRKDQKYCNFLYEEFKEKVIKEMMDVIMLLPMEAEIFQEEHNPAIASLKKYSGTEAWAPHGFHNFSKKDVRNLVIKEVQEAEKNGNISKEQIVLFGKNPEKIAKIDNIILHFDDLIPDGFKRKKLDAATIAMFMRWCGVTDEEHFIAYFNKVYERNPSHQYETVTKGAVNAAKNKLLRVDYDDTLYNEFVQKIEKQYFIPTIQQKEIVNS